MISVMVKGSTTVSMFHLEMASGTQSLWLLCTGKLGTGLIQNTSAGFGI